MHSHGNRPLLAFALALSTLHGCGDSGSPSAPAAAQQPAPCELMSDTLLSAHLEFAPDAEISRTPSKHSPHPLCSISVPKPNAAELEQEREAAMADYIQRKLRGEDVKIPAVSAVYEVSLTLLPPAESPEQAMVNFDSAMNMLTEGITGGTEEVQVTFQADVEPVTGVGSKAMWAPRLHQLSVVDGVQVLHVTVNTGEGDKTDRDKAIGIARDLAAAL